MTPRTFCLWGWRRGEWGYGFTTGEHAHRHRLPVVGWHDFQRHLVTVAVQPHI